MADATSEALAAPSSFPWGRVLGFSALVSAAYSAVVAALSFGANAALVSSTSLTVPGGPDVHLGLPHELVGFFVGGAVACLVGGLVAAFFARRIWRRDHDRLGWGFLIAVPVMVVAGAPIGVLS